MGYKEIRFDKNTKFLVTGGAGFIGSNIAEYLLSQGYFVRVLDNLITGKQSTIDLLTKYDNFEFILGDIRELETCQKACEGIDYISHQAALGSVPRSIKEPILSCNINIVGTLNMLIAARDAKVKRFVYASSSSVYGDEPNLPKVEGKEGKLLSPYAITKKVDEFYAKNFFDLFGLETVGMRYFNVFGKRQDPESVYAAVIPQFLKKLINGEAPVINGSGEHSRDFCFIENVIEANLKGMIASKEACGEAFNIAFGGQINLNELVDIMTQFLKSDIKPVHGPERVGDIKHSKASIEKAKRLLGYAPDYDVYQGLEITMEWYKANL